jgi:hypothetical protein
VRVNESRVDGTSLQIEEVRAIEEVRVAQGQCRVVAANVRNTAVPAE